MRDRIYHYSVPLLAAKASSVWGCRLHCFCEAVAHCFAKPQAAQGGR